MILITDSGATKADWCVSAQGKQLQRIVTKGLNPYFTQEDEIEREIKSSLLPELQCEKIDAVYFYGSGCTPEKIPTMQNVLSKCFDTKNIEINSDMLGAARGLCGRNPGIVSILGTGSNSCFYDGKEIVSNVSPLGYILGDEGSGAVLGKLLVGDLLKNQLPQELKEKFLLEFDLTPAKIIERVYRQPFPNRFLASFSPFILKNIEEPALKSLVFNSFMSFLVRNVMQYDFKQYPVHFTGSIAFYFRVILEEAVLAAGMKLGNVVRNPVEVLAGFHFNH